MRGVITTIVTIGLGGNHAIARREHLFPGVSLRLTRRAESGLGLACFYPPRSLHGEVPLDGLCFLMQEICWDQ